MRKATVGSGSTIGELKKKSHKSAIFSRNWAQRKSYLSSEVRW